MVGVGSGSCPVAGFGISGCELSGSAISVTCMCINAHMYKRRVNKHLSVAINFDF
jgi:hypothetical protein